MRYRAVLVVVTFGMFLGCAEGDMPRPEATPTSFNSANDPTVAFSVPDMMCPEGCGEKTKEILAEQPGAKGVLIDFDARTATVAVEDDAFDAQQALAALVDHGFDQSTLKDDATAKPQAADASVVQ